MKEYRAAKVNLGNDTFYIANFNEEGYTNNDAYLMGLSEVIEEIKKETSAEGLQIHTSCVEFINNKRPRIDEGFPEYNDQYMDYFYGDGKVEPQYPNHVILLKDNKDNYYSVEVDRYFMYRNLREVLHQDFVERDYDGQPVWKVFEFVADIINNPLIDHNKGMIFYEMFWWKKEKDIALKYLNRYAYCTGSKACESEIYGWIDIDRVA